MARFHGAYIPATTFLSQSKSFAIVFLLAQSYTAVEEKTYSSSDATPPRVRMENRNIGP